jgi:signal transduction histidine kinase
MDLTSESVGVGRLLPRSIVGWFTVAWGAFVLAALVVGFLLLSLYRESTVERLRRAEAAVAHGCEAIASRYRFLTAGVGGRLDAGDPALARGVAAAVALALRDLPGVEGGVWQVDAGSLGYAYPTYEGGGVKTDVPEAELPRIREAAETAALDGAPVSRRRDAATQTLLLQACPLAGPLPRAAAWTMTRVATIGGAAYAQAAAGLGVLFVVLAGSAAWIGHLLYGWSRRLRRLELALAAGDEELPRLAPTGQRDLDRIVDAVNRAGDRLAEARLASARLAERAAEAERLASIGRLAAGVAHEIRNPMAAMRLKAENALAANADDGRRERALTAILEQIGRLDRVLRDLLGSVQRPLPQPAAVALPGFLAARAELFRELAESRGLTVKVDAAAASAEFDPALVGQAIDNLLLNAIQNTPPEGTVRLGARGAGARLVLAVADSGRGVPPELRDRLFEPFVTGRPDGTGLGLALVREVAEAHGGAVRAVHRPDGTTIEMELPWRRS